MTKTAKKQATTTLIPLGARLLVRPDDMQIDPEAYSEHVDVRRNADGDVITRHGIVMPDTVKDQAERQALTGEIIAVGPACEWKELTVGDRILFGDHAPWPLGNRVVGYEGCVLLQEDDVFCLEQTDA